MSTKKIIYLSKIEFSNNDSYSNTKLKLVKLHKLIRSSQNPDLIDGVFNKLFDVFINQNKYIKMVCIPIFKDVNYKIRKIDNIKITRMFYQNDPDITKLALKFIYIFYKFFINDYIILFYLKTVNNNLSKKIIEKLTTIRHKEISKYDKLEKSFKILYDGKISKFLAEFNKIKTNDIDYKFKCIIGHFISKFEPKETNNFTFIAKNINLDESLICTINGYKKSNLYKKLLKCYKHWKYNK